MASTLQSQSKGKLWMTSFGLLLVAALVANVLFFGMLKWPANNPLLAFSSAVVAGVFVVVLGLWSGYKGSLPLLGFLASIVALFSHLAAFLVMPSAPTEMLLLMWLALSALLGVATLPPARSQSQASGATR